MAKASKKAAPDPKKKDPVAKAPKVQPKGPIIQGEPILEWRANPWQTRGKKLAILVGVFFVMVLLVAWIAPNDQILLLILPIMLVGSSAPHLFPSHYIVTTEGIFWGNFVSKTFKPWKAFKTVATYADALELFYDPANMRNRILRGILVYFNNNRDEASATIRRLWAAQHPEHQENIKEA